MGVGVRAHLAGGRRRWEGRIGVRVSWLSRTRVRVNVIVPMAAVPVSVRRLRGLLPDDGRKGAGVVRELAMVRKVSREAGPGGLRIVLGADENDRAPGRVDVVVPVGPEVEEREGARGEESHGEREEPARATSLFPSDPAHPRPRIRGSSDGGSAGRGLDRDPAGATVPYGGRDPNLAM